MNKIKDNKFILSYINITQLELCRELNKQMQFVNENKKTDPIDKKECIKFLKSIKKNILILSALKRKKFDNEPK